MFIYQTLYNKLLVELMNHIYVISPQFSKSFRRVEPDGHNSSFGQNTRRSFKYTPLITPKYINKINFKLIFE